jgi:predicted Zn-dependent protease
LDDEELAAAVAHELGHLLNDGHLQPVASLKGCERDADLDNESKADVAGMSILASTNIRRSAMITMLQKVGTAAGLSPACRDALTRRQDVLNRRLSRVIEPTP